MKKQTITIRIDKFRLCDFEGELDEVIDVLNELKELHKGKHLVFNVDSWFEEEFLELIYTREETDEEYAKRIEIEKNKRKRTEKFERDRLKELKKKYEK